MDRKNTLTLALSDDELRLLELLAEQRGLPPADFMRTILREAAGSPPALALALRFARALGSPADVEKVREHIVEIGKGGKLRKPSSSSGGT